MTSSKYLCFICSEATTAKNHTPFVKTTNPNNVTFILRILLEVPQFKLADQHIHLLLKTLTEQSKSSPLSFSDYWLNICDQCFIAVQQAEQIYSEILAATQKFRRVQRKLVEILRQSWKAQRDTQPKSQEPFPFKLCRKFANDHNFNNFGYPFTIQNVNCTSPPSTTIQAEEDEVTTSPFSSPSAASSTLSSSDSSDDSDYQPSSPSSLEPPVKRLRSSHHSFEIQNQKSVTLRRPRPPHSTDGPIPMTRALFLNIAAVTDLERSTKSFDPLEPPYVMLGKVRSEELPSLVSFPHGLDPTSDLLRLISGHKVDFQTKVLSQSKDILLDSRKLVWSLKGKDNNLPEGRIYYMTDLSKKEEMEAVGPSYQEWKEVGGVLGWLHPGLNCIANLGFIFSQKRARLGIHMEDLRFSSVNILFQGRKEWDIVNPEDTEELIAELKESHKELREEEMEDSGWSGCGYWVLHKNIWVGEETKKRWRVSTFVQERGDVVMVPPGVLHQVRNLEDCVAASYNFVDGDWVEMGGGKEGDGERYFECCCCSHGGKQLLGRGEVERLREAHGQVRVYADYQVGRQGDWEEGKKGKYCGRATAEFFDKVGMEDWGKEEGSGGGDGKEGGTRHSQGSATTEEFDPTWSEPSEPEVEEGRSLEGSEDSS